MTVKRISRRTVLRGLGAAAPLLAAPTRARAEQGGGDPGLPFDVTFIEHLGTVVPDVTAATIFYSRLFDPAIMTEEQPVPLRLYVPVGRGYLAFGARPNEPRTFFDHFCMLIDGYDAEMVQATLEADGFAPNPAFMLVQDPDGIGVQYYRHPGGWFPTVIPAAPLVEGPPLVTPRGLSHVMLNVSDLDASIAYYLRYVGPRDVRHDATLAWFELEDCRLVLRAAPEGAAPGIDHIGVRVAGTDFDAVGAALSDMGAAVGRLADEPRVLRFVDPVGLRVELQQPLAAGGGSTAYPSPPWRAEPWPRHG